MTNHTINNLVEARERIVKAVMDKELGAESGANLLGITRQGLWKIIKRVEKQGMTKSALLGNKRGPKKINRSWNRIPAWIEAEVEKFWRDYSVGPDNLVWIIEDNLGVTLSRSTVYRILVRRKLITPKEKGPKEPAQLYEKGYPGEEVQIDATEPFGKSNGILMTAIDDHTRWVKAEIYRGNNSQNAADFLERLVRELPFPITSVRVDNGAEFKGDFIARTKELGIKLIRNPVGSPQKNGKVERMHRTIEEECLWRVGAKPSKLTEAQYQLSRYLAWYNHKRKHLGHGMNTSPRLKLEKWLINSLEEDYQEKNLADVNETLIRYKT